MNIELNPGEEICPRCEGRYREKSYISAAGYEITPLCFLCDGNGKIDWVKKAMGVRRDAKYELCSSRWK